MRTWVALVCVLTAGRAAANPVWPASSSTFGAWKQVLRDQQFSGVVSVLGAEGTLFEFVDNGGQREQRPIHDDDLFWIGSVSKQFAAAAVLRLVSQSRVALDAPVARYLPLAEGALTRQGVPCTVEHLLSSTCGLPPGSKVCSDVDLDLPQNRARYLRCVERVQLEFEPGTRHLYANLGFGIAGLLVSSISGHSYEDFLRREFFEPLGMSSSGVTLRAAHLSRLAPGELWLKTASLPTVSWLWLDPRGPGRRGASGNLFSTAGDLHRWNRALHGGKLFSRELYDQFVRPRHDDYGLGIVSKRENDAVWYWHNGGLMPMGWSSHLAFVPSLDLSIVVLTNRGPEVSRMDDVGFGVVRSALLGSAPALPPLADDAYAFEIFFSLLPAVFYLCLCLQVFFLLRGPRGALASWVTALAATGAAVIVLLSILDFYRDHRWLLALQGLAVGVSVVVHRRRWVGRILDASSLRLERTKALAGGLAVVTLLYALRGDDRLWMILTLACIGLPAGGVLALCRRRAQAAPQV